MSYQLISEINNKSSRTRGCTLDDYCINEIGVKENSDKTNTPRIIEYFDATELKGQAGTKSWGWCSAFANWVMKQAGYTGTNSGKAESWLNWGTTLSEPVYGCITVTLKNGLYHVGFYSGLGAKKGAINLLGGNQTNQVMYQQYYYFQTDVVWYAWPNP
jgi:uncharacterized protein (TIGR02594 family)